MRLKTVLAGLFVLAFATASFAQGPRCSLGTLKGSYGGNLVGNQPFTNAAGVVVLEQVVGVVVREYDGGGGFTQVANVKGSLSGWTPDRRGNGTYTINEDCSGTITFSNPAFMIQERIVIVDNAREIRAATMQPPGLFVTSTAKRI